MLVATRQVCHSCLPPIRPPPGIRAATPFTSCPAPARGHSASGLWLWHPERVLTARGGWLLLSLVALGCLIGGLTLG